MQEDHMTAQTKFQQISVDALWQGQCERL